MSFFEYKDGKETFSVQCHAAESVFIQKNGVMTTGDIANEDEFYQLCEGRVPLVDYDREVDSGYQFEYFQSAPFLL